nr:heavy metal translocating P-type ATPase [Chloroflexaceae bacterium]
QDFTDRVIGQYYAYAVVGITLLAILIPLLFLGWDVQTTLYRAMTLMVVASPCALVISIPAALLSALASAARGGVLFKGGAHLEAAATVTVVAFDKTGTLTTGKPSVSEMRDWRLEIGQSESPISYLPSPVLALAAAIEQFSEHPLAEAIVQAAREQKLAIPAATDFSAMTGAGARAIINGVALRIGRPTLFAPLAPELARQVAEQEQQGRTVVLLGDEQPWGMIALADTLRPEAAATLAALRRNGVQRIVLLTGDNRHAAESLARTLGIDEVRAGLLPADKVTAVRELQERYGPVAMVGDGVNDAPALATARLGVAMGAAGTDVALESADLLLVADDLSKLPGALKLARRARRVVRQNLTFALGVIALLVAFSLAGEVPLPLGVVGHEGSTLLVVANGLRLLLGRLDS